MKNNDNLVKKILLEQSANDELLKHVVIQYINTLELKQTLEDDIKRRGVCIEQMQANGIKVSKKNDNVVLLQKSITVLQSLRKELEQYGIVFTADSEVMKNEKTEKEYFL